MIVILMSIRYRSLQGQMKAILRNRGFRQGELEMNAVGRPVSSASLVKVCALSVLSAANAVLRGGTTLVVTLAACAPATTTRTDTAPLPGATPTAEPAADLPPVPAADGPLALDVVHPVQGQELGTDSTFIFGSTGSGRAQLTINGAVVEIAPNGAFLAFLPVPRDGVYRLEALKEGATASMERTVRVPRAGLPDAAAAIVAGSAYPRGALAVTPEQAVEIGFRGTRGGSAWLVLPGGDRVVLHEVPGRRDAGDRDFVTDPGTGAAQPAPWSRYEGVLVPRPIVSSDTAIAQPVIGDPTLRALQIGTAVVGATKSGQADARDAAVLGQPVGVATAAVAAETSATGARFELIVGPDTARAPLPLNLRLLDPVIPRVGVVSGPIDAGPDWEARGRPHTSGPFHWFWPHGTRLQIVEQQGGMLRARLTETLSAWLPVGDVRLLPPGTPAPFAAIGGVRMVHRHDAIDVHVPMAEALPFRIDEDGNTLTIDVYGAKSTSNFFQYGRLDPLIGRAEWSQPDDEIYRVTLQLTQPVWGYDAYRAANGDLVVRVRRPPPIDPARPLHGLRVAVDAGHPPAGATGPTRLKEADANLWIAQGLVPMLEERGAHVIMIRPDTAAVALGDRPQMAADSNAHVLVSIHNNAFPDGVNPFRNNGTSVYYFHPQSARLAQHMQRELLAELRLRDIGIGRADLALVRPTWMPAVLTETMYLMIPQQEAALRNPDVQRRIAAAHLRALEAFLRERAGEQ